MAVWRIRKSICETWSKKTNGKLLSYNSLGNKQKDDFVICFGVGLFMATEISRKIPFSDPLEMPRCITRKVTTATQSSRAVVTATTSQLKFRWKLVAFPVWTVFFFGKETKQTPGALQTQFKRRSVAKYIQGCISGNQIGHCILVQSHCSSSALLTPSWVWHDGSRSRFFKRQSLFLLVFLASFLLSLYVS